MPIRVNRLTSVIATMSPLIESESEELTPIQNFFNGKSVFITGGSGFLGKVLTEKLLRSCPGVNTIYVLIRTKKDQIPEERYEKIISDILFDEVRKQNPNFRSKIVLIPGDCYEINLGMSEEHMQLLHESVSVVIHAAATVRFDENLKSAIMINVSATKEIIKLCHSLPKLESFVYVSTAYSQCYAKIIKEDVEEWREEFEEALTLSRQLTHEEVDEKLGYLWKKWPNTYTFTKAMAECFVKKEEGRLPACIFRPAIVVSTMSEPLPGWIDNYLGPTGLVLGAGCGVVRVMQCDTKTEANIVPVDLVINAILAASYETAKSFRNDDKNILTYNYSSSTDNPLTYEHFENRLHKFGVIIPSVKAVWYYSLILCRSKSIALFLSLLVHWMPALLLDIAAITSGKKPVMLKLYKKVQKMTGVLGYFATKRWQFETNNVHSLWDKTSAKDKKLFNFDIRSVKWDPYLKNYLIGARVYVLKDDLSTLKVALKKWNRLYWCHQVLKFVFTVLCFMIVSFIFRKIIAITLL